MNYIDLFVLAARKNENRAAIVDRNTSRTVTYGELDRLSSLAAGKIHAAGCGEGDFAVIWLESTMEYVAACLGILKAGCAMVPLIMQYPQERVDYIIGDCNARLVIRQDFFDDIDRYEEYCAPAGDDVPALVIYTSGSTGNPKGVCHTVGSVYAAAVRQAEDAFRDCQQHRHAVFAPFSFVASFTDIYVRLLLGNTLYLLSDEVKRSPQLLLDFLTDNKMDDCYIPPQMLRMMNGRTLPLKLITTGGEAIGDIFLPGNELYSCYGQSETMSCAASYHVNGPCRTVPIGEMLYGLTAHILDEDGREITDGETGELCIEGKFGVRYLNDPEKTAKTFIRLENGNTLIHTGDNVRRNENGDLIYVSRRDWMVKVNGQRVETMEVERTLNAVDGIAVSAVRAWTDSNTQTYIAGYYEAETEITEEQVRAALSQKLPGYMIPRFLIRMDALPRNINGKLDRNSLPEPDLDSYRATYRAPANETEELLCEGFSAALNCGKTGADDDFIALGGDSVKVLKLLGNVNIPGLTAGMILEGRTPAGIAALLERSKETGAEHTDEIPALCPMTEAQLGVYMECIEAPGSLKYNIPAWVRLPEDTDIGRYIRAIRTVAETHPVFGVTACVADGIPSMRYQPKDIVVEETEAGSPGEALKRFIRPFDPEQGPLYRFEICRCPGGAIFLFDVHHLIFDGTSLEVFAGQIGRAYDCGEILPEALNIFDISAYERDMKQTAGYLEAQDFFRSRFEGVSVKSIPETDKSSHEKMSGSGSVTVLTGGSVNTDAVGRFVKQHGITENTLLMGAFAYLLKIFAGTDEICFTTVNSGRHDSRLSESIGMFVRTLPLHFAISDQEEVAAFLKDIQDTFFETMKHDCISFGELVSAYGVSTDVSFVYQAEMLNGVNAADNGEAVSAMDVMVFRENNGYRAVFRYDRSRYSEAYVRSLTETYLCVIAGMLNSERLSGIRLTTEHTERLTDSVNDTDYPVEYSAAHQLFEKQAAEHPDRTAVIAAGERLTYGELNTAADRAAGALCDLGLKREGIVGIVLPRKKEAMIAELAVWKASGAFLPMTPSYPDDRIVYCLEDSGAQFVITTEEIKNARPEIFGGIHPYACLTVEGLLKHTESFDGTVTDPAQPAYCIYTSGSTGKPKGVMIEHRNFCNFVHANEKNEETFNIVRNGSLMLSIAALSFDFSLLETWLPLCNGLGVCMATDEEIHDPFALARLIIGEKVDLMAATPSFIMGIIDIDEVREALKNIRCYDFGAEAFPSVLFDKLTAIRQDAVIINGYGPTETTVSCISKVITDGKNITIGRPAANVCTYIMDQTGRMLPMGAPGELIIAGDGVGRGYMNLPEKTAESFFEVNGKRAYHSGDFCRMNADGEIEFFGRLDNQVKLRGLRVELDEIENAMLKIHGMKSVKVIVRRSGTEDFLAGFYTADHDITPEEIQAALKETLPAYMIPNALMQLEKMPLNANGKINKAELPEITYVAAELTPPETETQRQIFDLATEIIGHAGFGVDTDLYEAGLASLGAIRLTAMMDKQFGIPVSISVIRECHTVRNLESWLQRNTIRTAYELQADYPLTQTQEGIAVECLSNPETTVYNIPCLIELGKNVDADRLIAALKETVNAHPYLKTRLFADENGRIRARRLDDAEPEVKLVTGEVPAPAELIRPFHLFEDVLYRLTVYHCPEGCCLFADFHHIVFDGASESIFFEDLNRAYAGEKPEKESYTGYEAALEEEEARASDAFAKAEAYYRSVFDGCEPDNLPPLDPVMNESSTGNLRLELNGLRERVEAFCRENKVTENAFFNAAFGYALCKLSGREDSVYATVYNGRNDSRKADSISMYVKTLPVHCMAAGDDSIADYIRNTGKQLMASMANDLYSFADVSREFGIRSDVMFVWQGENSDPETLCGESCTFRFFHPDTAKAAMMIQIFANRDGYVISAEFLREMFGDVLMNSMLLCLEQVIREFAEKKDLRDIDLLSGKCREAADGFNRTESAYDPAQTVVDQFRARVAMTPDNIAVVYEEHTYTYAETDRLSDNIATYLMKNGIGREDAVAVLIGRSEYMPIASLGILKSGAAYQPLDPSYPEERLNFMVHDSGAKLLIADRDLTGILKDWQGETLLTEDIPGLPDTTDDERLQLQAVAPKAEDLFILLYTSGSTGTPKGAMLVHRNLMAFCHWYRGACELNEDSCAAAYASYGFDACMMDMYPVLTAGGKLLIIPESIRLDLVKLNEVYRDRKVTHAFMTTQVGRQFAQICDSPYLKYLLVGGEALVPVTPPEGFRLINIYGPTECTVCITTKHVDRLYRRVPIGKALDNIKLYVVDKNMKRLPAGVPGELCAAGPQVSRGYLNLPEKTGVIYVNNPFDHEPGYELMYRTGDIVRLLPDGMIDFIGRNDGQVKVRGFRIELNEVEEVIRRFDGIRDATVAAFDAPGGGKELAAYVVSDQTVNIQALKEFIRGEKPAYMVPAVIMQIDRIPLNQNQKVNRRALPKPEMTSSDADHASAGAPLNRLEEKLQELISELLGGSRPGLTETLSSYGFSSLSAIRMATLIYKQYGVQLAVKSLAASGTIQSIENEILTAWMTKKDPDDEKDNSRQAEKQPEEQTADSKQGRILPLSFSQQGVFAECQASPENRTYNLPACLGFPGTVTAETLKQALLDVIAAHPAFATRFVVQANNEIGQTEDRNFVPDIPVRTMDTDCFARYRDEFSRPFRLLEEPLCRFEIVQTDKLYLLMDMHHLIVDGGSVDIFMHDLCRRLEGVAPEKEDYTCFDAVADEKLTEEAETFFENYLAEYEESTQLIPDVYDKDADHSEGTVNVPTDLLRTREFASKNGVTSAAVYLAAEYIACARYCCDGFAAISTISNGRSNLKLYRTLGMFVNTLPLYLKVPESEDTLSFVRRVGQGFTDVLEHENYPFARVAKKFDFRPMVSYAYQVGVLNEMTVHGEKVSVDEISLDRAKLPVSVFINGTENGGVIQVSYDRALFSENMMLGFAQSIENVARELTEKENLNEISLTDEKQWKVLDSWQRPFDLNYDHSDTAVSLFRKQAAMQPDKTAAVYADRSYTYRELDELTDRMAVVIRERMCRITGKQKLAEQAIPILTNRNENVFLLPLAVLKAGCAYEPLDRNYPQERLNFMVKDAGAALMIAENELYGTVSEYTGEMLSVSELLAEADNVSSEQIMLPEPGIHDLLILLYTSGTTGTPKGVQIEHGNLVAYAHGSSSDGFYTKDSRTAAYASFGFDVNMADTFCTLLNGGTLYVIPEDMRMNLDELAAYFDEAGITEVLLTTQVGVQFLNRFPKMKTLRTLTVGGEKLPAISTENLSYQINNGYGPTENCCGVSLFPVRSWEPNIPLGKPMQTIHGYILDKTGHRLPEGAAGEYCLSGPQVSRGYLNRPDKTAEAFEQCPFNEFRMYHTGDIVRYRHNGDVEFVGRKDGQVKIRGFRVELKEIEAVIRSFEGIEDATVQPYDYETGGKYLAAFVVSRGTVDIKELNAFIKARKPAYMVPAVTMQIDSIPLTINQKVDKKRLPKPVAVKTEYIAPETEAEKEFCRIFGEILNVEKFSVEDDFFDLGGSSISAMKVVLAAEKVGYGIVYQDVFSCPTPRMLAEKAESLNEKATDMLSSETVVPAVNGGIVETGRDGYDYSDIHTLLNGNTLEAFRNGKMKAIRDVLLLGATGYLGVHVLRELIRSEQGNVYCLVRSKKGVSGAERLKEQLRYYFDDDFAGLFGKRLFVTDGDATDPKALEGFDPAGKELTVINCAANVAHFARGDAIERANIDSVNCLIDWCITHNVPLVHISTCSVMGSAENGMPPEGYRFTEHVLFAGQKIDENQYVYSKFMGERAIYEAILRRGLHAKVVRVSNLAPRYEDGMFQVNYQTNSFMSSLAAFRALGMISYEMMGSRTEFSPIDAVARAVLLLAGTPDACVCFMLNNPNQPFLGKVVQMTGTTEHPVRMVETETLQQAVQAALEDPVLSEKIRPLLAYETNDGSDSRVLGVDDLDAGYTTQVLYRLGFVWPEIDSAYVNRFAERLGRLGFWG